ncbi:MAG: DinB family protein [Janthinobacterium lividum]
MSQTQSNDPVVTQLHALLDGGNAHATLHKAAANFPEAYRGTVPDGLPYSAWQLLEHLRITQRDILNFSSPPAGGYQALQWPKEYWPATAMPPDAESWNRTLAAIEADGKAFLDLLTEPGADLYKPFAWGDGQNLLREALLIADHNSYHTGELVLLRRLLGIWPV